MYFFIVILLPTLVTSHGYLCDPPSRNAAWLCGYPEDTPKNYDQMALNAGGVHRTYPNYPDRYPLLYGVCGDPVERSQDHAAGGIHDRGVRREYRRGDEVQIQITVTAGHKGEFDIQLCNTYPEREDCFYSISKFSINDSPEGLYGNVSFPITLPQNISCDHCVLRWFWTTNNSPGLPPEIFINCADITIV